MIALMVLGSLAIYVGIAVLVTRGLMRIAPSDHAKRIVKYSCVAVFILIPTWDVILGRAYFYYLCATEGGIKVYRQVELPAEYWDEEGRPKTSLSNELNYRTQIGQRHHLKVEDQSDYVKWLRIDREIDRLIDLQTSKIIAELVHFRYWGGWLVNSTGLHVGASGCPGRGIYRKFYNSVFIKGD